MTEKSSIRAVRRALSWVLASSLIAAAVLPAAVSAQDAVSPPQSDVGQAQDTASETGAAETAPSADPIPETEPAADQLPAVKSSPASEAQSPQAEDQPVAETPGGTLPVEDLPIEDLEGLQDSAQASDAAGEAAGADQTASENSTLPHDLSPWGMYLQADIVVKAVMIGLAFASVVTWTVWLAKSVELFSARSSVKRGLRAISTQSTLAGAAQALGNRKGIVRAYIDMAALELRMSTDTPDKEGIKERVASRLERVESAAVRKMNRGTGVLATIGSTAPFVGLFGTVWGIMNSFIGISKSQTTNLAVVAPGIAEALLATAIGLVAAIPAVIIYNWFSRGIGVYRAHAGDASAEVMRLVSRDLDRVDSAHRHAYAAE